MTEYEKMIAGLPYNGLDPELLEMSEKADRLCTAYNLSGDKKERADILKTLIGECKDSVTLQGPIHFTYGKNISLGEFFYANFNFTVLDHGGVTIGDHVMIGPNCTLATAEHPIDCTERRVQVGADGCFDTETAAPIRIGDDCWLGAGVIVCPGVSIGTGSVIGAGSVVTNDIPEGVVAVGVPCRVLRRIGKNERKEEE